MMISIFEWQFVLKFEYNEPNRLTMAPEGGKHVSLLSKQNDL